MPPEGVAVEHTNGKSSSALSDTVDYSRVLHNGVSRDVSETLPGEHDQAKHQETTVLQAQVSELSAALEHSRSALERAESQNTRLEAPIDRRDDAREGPALTAEAIGAMISSRFADLQSHWNEAHTRQYRQLVSQLAEIQSDLDNISTSMQALQPMDLDEPRLDSSLLEQILTRLEAVPAQAVDGENSDSVDELTRLRDEVQGLRSDLQAVLQSASVGANEGAAGTPDLAFISALRASQENQRRWLEERDVALYGQLDELRSRLESAASDSQQLRSPAGEDAWHEALIELRSEILQALESIRATSSVESTTPSDSLGTGDSLAELVASLQQFSANQARILESQQQRLQADIGQMREEMRSALSVLTSENMDTFEKRQSQLRMDQLEMERNLAQLRQELVTTQADPGNKKKLWR
jgi:hypothetical protein